MRLPALVLAAACLTGSALAQQQGDADVRMSATDQVNALAVCALAMRSPTLVEADAVITIGEFCVRLRTIINAARNATPQSQPEKDPK